MQIQNDRSCWRTSFLGGLQLLAQAAARLPVGVQDPILGGSSAVELYTGGLWAKDPNLEVFYTASAVDADRGAVCGWISVV